MIKKIECATMQGIQAKIVELEIAFIKGLPAFNITGLANQTVQEAKHRSSAALAAAGFLFPPLKVNINLSPSDLPKHGSHFDFPIALLIALYRKNISPHLQKEYFAIGELGLDGKIKSTESIYPILLDLSTQHYEGIILAPKDQIEIYKKIPYLKLIGIQTIQEAITLFDSKEAFNIDMTSHELHFDSIQIFGEEYYFTQDFKDDFKDIEGQQNAKRAALIAASGFHSILFEGNPGCGKSMIAKRMQYILPPLSRIEILKNAKMRLYLGEKIVYSPSRPFRSPHASCSKAALLGSSIGNEAKPGEITLASSGILFLDELPYFPLQHLESLRESLENRSFTLSRAQTKIEYEAAFMLVCAQNPCPCGNLMSKIHECRCSDSAIMKYKNRLSEPFLDRIDLYVSMEEETKKDIVHSKELFEKMLIAFKQQKQRKQKNLNGHLNDSDIETVCILTEESQSLLKQASQRFGFSYRSINKVKKVARTIADLEESTEIKKEHILEALSYRRMQ